MTELKILQNKIDDEHQDSFWYDGLIATAGEYELVAAGDIRVYFEDENGGYIGMHDGYKARDGFPQPENDKALQPLYDSDDGYRMDMNNWFEVINQDGDCIGDICESYDEGIEWLKEVSDGKY